MRLNTNIGGNACTARVWAWSLELKIWLLLLLGIISENQEIIFVHIKATCKFATNNNHKVTNLLISCSQTLRQIHLLARNFKMKTNTFLNIPFSFKNECNVIFQP